MLRVGVICTIADHVLPTEALYPWQACVLPQHLCLPTKSLTLQATPFYNSTLRSECCLTTRSETIKARQIQFPGLLPASKLLAVWLRQRGLDSSITKGGFGAFEAVSILAILLGSPDAGNLSGWHEPKNGSHGTRFFESLLRFIATTDLNRQPVALHCEREQFERLSNLSGPILFDGLSGINVLYKMSQPSYYQVRTQISVPAASNAPAAAIRGSCNPVVPWAIYPRHVHPNLCLEGLRSLATIRLLARVHPFS